MKHLQAVLAVLGFLAAALSVALDDHWLGWLAIGLLAASLLIRVIKQKKGGGTKEEPPL
jgi:hypothetical protein